MTLILTSLLGYYWLQFSAKPASETGLSDDAYVAIGYSTIALLAIFIAAAVLALIPIVLTRRTLKGSIPLGGTNSIVLSAACHVPNLEEKAGARSHNLDPDTTPTEHQMESATEENENEQITSDEPGRQQDPESGTFEMQRLLTFDAAEPDKKCSDKDKDEENSSHISSTARKYLLDASEKPLRWGAVETPPSNQQYTDQGDIIGHLSFGTRDHCVQEPVDGQWYA